MASARNSNNTENNNTPEDAQSTTEDVTTDATTAEAATEPEWKELPFGTEITSQLCLGAVNAGKVQVWRKDARGEDIVGTPPVALFLTPKAVDDGVQVKRVLTPEWRMGDSIMGAGGRLKRTISDDAAKALTHIVTFGTRTVKNENAPDTTEVFPILIPITEGLTMDNGQPKNVPKGARRSVGQTIDPDGNLWNWTIAPRYHMVPAGENETKRVFMLHPLAVKAGTAQGAKPVAETADDIL